MIREQRIRFPILFGDATMHMIAFSNWTKAGLFEMDFSAAAVRPRREPLRASYIQHNQLSLQIPEGFLVMGKDYHENYWLCGYRVKGQWALIEKALSAVNVN